jgi:hypothetical protein
MIKFRLLLSALILSAHLISQTAIKCTVLDSSTHQPVEFANVGIASKGLGTVTNEKGEFSLSIPDSLKNDKVRISILGYRTREIKQAELARTGSVLLSPSSYKLNEVVIKPGKPKFKTLGNKTTSKNMICGFSSNNLGCEMAVKLNIKHKETWIKKLSFNIVKNIYDDVIFRVNIYKKDKDGNPGENLLKQNLLISPKTKTGLVEVDLTPYFLLADDDVFVSIEWIKDLGDAKGLYFSCEMLGGTYYRKASQDKWEHSAAVGVGLFVDVQY